MTLHYKYGGSTAKRTDNCPAWIELAQGLPNLSSQAAELGTALHKVLEDTLNDDRINPFDFVGTVVEGVKITEAHIIEKIYPALDAFEDLMDSYDVEEYICELSMEYAKDIGGTIDFLAWSKDRKTLIVGDYKSGDGIMVDAEDNAQLKFYAMCLLKTEHAHLLTECEKVVFAIVQPSERRQDILDTWESTAQVVYTYEVQHNANIIATQQENTAPVAGEHCTFCPAHVNCPAKAQLIREMETTPLETLTTVTIPNALKLADEIESWVKEVRKKAHELMERGHEVEGYKLVKKRATRKWEDNATAKDKAMKMLHKDDVIEEKMKSPAQIEKACKAAGKDFKEEFGDFVVAVSSGTTIALSTDSRPAAVDPKVAAKVAAFIN